MKASVLTEMLGACAPQEGTTVVTKWKIEPRYKDEVDAIEVVSETDCFVTLSMIDWRGKLYERRIRKDGPEQVFDTFEAAKEALVENSRQRVKNAEAGWQREKDRLKKRNDIKAPNVFGVERPPARGEVANEVREAARTTR